MGPVRKRGNNGGKMEDDTIDEETIAKLEAIELRLMAEEPNVIKLIIKSYAEGGVEL